MLKLLSCSFLNLWPHRLEERLRHATVGMAHHDEALPNVLERERANAHK
jgi:hypothetical protein